MRCWILNDCCGAWHLSLERMKRLSSIKIFLLFIFHGLKIRGFSDAVILILHKITRHLPFLHDILWHYVVALVLPSVIDITSNPFKQSLKIFLCAFITNPRYDRIMAYKGTEMFMGQWAFCCNVQLSFLVYCTVFISNLCNIGRHIGRKMHWLAAASPHVSPVLVHMTNKTMVPMGWGLPWFLQKCNTGFAANTKPSKIQEKNMKYFKNSAKYPTILRSVFIHCSVITLFATVVTC